MKPEESFFYRSYQLDRGLVDEESRSVGVTFSSENPVMRWFGNEILLHGENNVDLKRLRDIGAALLNHNPDSIVGPVSGVSIEDRKGKATIGFDDDDEGNRAMGKVKSGSLRGISVGYRVDTYQRLIEGEKWEDPDTGRGYRGPAYIATRWEPVEISLTPIPADAKSKVGRELARSFDGINIRSTQTREGEEMEKQDIINLIDEKIRGLKIPTMEDIVSGVRTALKEDQKPKLGMDVERGIELASQAGAVSPECQNEIRGMVLGGKTESECLRKINETLMKRTDAGNTPPAGGGDFNEERSADFEKMNDDEFADQLRNLDDYSV